MIRLALFDLDNTLLDGDSDIEWGELIALRTPLDIGRLRAFHVQYHAGTLDIDAFLRFQLEPLAREPLERLHAWRREFVDERIVPLLSSRARALVERHRALGHELALISATNRFLCEPIAHELGIEHVIATEPEMRQGRFTGRVDGIPCYRRGKITRLEQWLGSRRMSLQSLAESWFYSDSHNDLPLLSLVDHPVAVDPDAKLCAHARAAGWTILRLRQSDMPYSSPPIG